MMIVYSARLGRLALADLCGPGVNSAYLMWPSVASLQRAAGSVGLIIQGPAGPRGGRDAADLEDRLPTDSRWSGAR